ncbi:MAG: DUF89 family protein [Sedimentisphaerales bacterium]|nr:DUF89 family protein [Sedimentisphaerales bacterium]
MKTYLDCIPCFVRHCLDSVRMITDDSEIQADVLRRALVFASEVNFDKSPPVTAQKIHRFIREVTGSADPYAKVKKHGNDLAMQMYPELKKSVELSNNALAVAVRLAIAGNIIDYGTDSHISQEKVEKAVGEALRLPLDGHALEVFAEAVDLADDILYLGDNAGEIVFDRLLIEQLPSEKVTFVVRGGPILNDALMADAEAVGLSDIVSVIDNGSDAPGTIFEDCCEDFRRRFEGADMVIAKGQGNYETLSDVGREMFFLLQPKCRVLAEHLSSEIGSLVLMHKKNDLEKGVR